MTELYIWLKVLVDLLFYVVTDFLIYVVADLLTEILVYVNQT